MLEFFKCITLKLGYLLTKLRIIKKKLLHELAHNSNRKQAGNIAVTPGLAVDQHQPREQREDKKQRHENAHRVGQRIDE